VEETIQIQKTSSLNNFHSTNQQFTVDEPQVIEVDRDDFVHSLGNQRITSLSQQASNANLEI
jgi:hypothetical protein